MTYNFINYTTKYNENLYHITLILYVIPTLTHHYNTRQDTLQQHRTIPSFADHSGIHAMIALINKHTIKFNIATSQSY